MASLNFLALKKTPEFMRIFKAPDGFELFQFDTSSLEVRIMAHMSQDTNLLKVFGKDANPHADHYLTTGAGLSIYRDKILQHYDPANPTAEMVKAAKKACEFERKKSKIVWLGWQYGQRAAALAAGQGISIEEATQITADMDRTYSGVVAWGEDLRRQWARNGGYIINGRGVPMCIDRKYLRDAGSRSVQSSGVMLLRRVTQKHLPEVLRERKLPSWAFVPNIHDEALIRKPTGFREGYRAAVDEAFDRLNDELQWSVEIKHGGVAFGPDMSIRCEE